MSTNDEISKESTQPADLAEDAGGYEKLKQAEEILKADIQQTAGPNVPQELEEVDGELRSPATPPQKPHTRTEDKQAVLVTPGVRHLLK